MGLLESTSEEPRSKLRRYVITCLALGLLVAGSLWYLFRFHAEMKTVETFFTALAAGDTEQAYRIWRAQPTYSYADFLQHWGPSGEFGPVKSFHIETAQMPRNASGVIVVVSVSSSPTFPAAGDPEGRRTIQQVRIWVERRDQSLSFPP